MIEKDIYSFLISFPDVTTLFADRITVGNIPEGANYPLAGICRISELPFDADIYSKNLNDYRIQLMTCDTDYDDAFTADGILRAHLEKYKGAMGASNIVHCNVVGRVPLFDDILHRWQIATDYTIRVRT